MKKVLWRGLCAGLLVAGMSGCVSTGTRAVEIGGVVAPDQGERVVVDEVLVVVDVSGSMYGPDKFRLGKELTRSFVASMPEGSYRAGLLSFGGEWTNEWVRHPAVPLDRDALLSKTAQISWLRGSTPLPVALSELQPGIAERSGHTAVVIFSDGGADRQQTLDIVDRIKTTHDGPICFYTVHLGHGCADGADCGDAKECSSKDEKAPCCKTGETKECSSKDEKAPCCKTGETKECSSKDEKACGSCNSIADGCCSADLRKNGHALLGAIAKLSDCGQRWDAEEVISQAGMAEMIDTIFFGPGDGDADGDGVPDSLDQCPNTPRGAKVDARGCWVLSGLNFDTDKSVIKPQFEGLLDDVAKVLNDNAGVNINIHVRIDGHTDSRASDGYNQALSERRANAVRDALVKRGVDAARLSTQGFGESKPIASNKTSAGRYQNRRVELTPVE